MTNEQMRVELPAQGYRVTSKLGTHVGFAGPEVRKGDVLYTAEQVTAAILADRERRAAKDAGAGDAARLPWDAQPGCHACGRARGAPCTEVEGCRNPPSPAVVPAGDAVAWQARNVKPDGSPDYRAGMGQWKECSRDEYELWKNEPGLAVRALGVIAPAAPTAPASVAVPTAVQRLKRAIDCLDILNRRPRPMCRDCTDPPGRNGVCDNGLDCDMTLLLKDSRAELAALAATQQAEPSAKYLVCTGVIHEGEETYTVHDKPVPLADNWKLYTAPLASKEATPSAAEPVMLNGLTEAQTSATASVAGTAETNPWLPHNGGPCPVAPDALVHVRFRDGGMRKAEAFPLRWDHRNSFGDIIEYRLHLEGTKS